MINRVFIFVLTCLLASLQVYADSHSDNADLDDIRNWDIVPIETCLDAVLDTIPGHARKVEMKMENDDPVYEFDIDAKDGQRYNVECNAEEGFVTEIEREVDRNNSYFKQHAKVSEKQARNMPLRFTRARSHQSEYEIGFNGEVTYEFDIQSSLGYEIKVDVNAVTGEIEEANIELYEIGAEAE